MKKNKGEWSELYVALSMLGEGKLYLADVSGEANPDHWLNVLDVIRHETKTRTVGYERKSESAIDISVDGNHIRSVPAKNVLFYANRLKDQILCSSGSSFSVGEELEEFFDSFEVKHVTAMSVEKSDIFISTEDPSTSIVRRNTGFSIKSKFGKDPTLFNTGKNSAAIYKISNMDDAFMETINSMVDKQGHTAISARCKALLEHGCEFEFVGFPVATRAKCRTFEENLDMINPRLGEAFDFVLRTHFLSDSTARNLEDMVHLLIENNPCRISRGEEKYPYMMKSFLYAAYCGLTAGTLWNGKSQVNGGFISVDGQGNVTANLALESEEFKSYLYKHCYFEWPSTSSSHGDYAYVYKENDEYFFKLNFQIRYR